MIVAAPAEKSRVSGKSPPSQGVPALPGILQSQRMRLVLPSAAVSGLATKPKGWSWRERIEKVLLACVGQRRRGGGRWLRYRSPACLSPASAFLRQSRGGHPRHGGRLEPRVVERERSAAALLAAQADCVCASNKRAAIKRQALAIKQRRRRCAPPSRPAAPSERPRPTTSPALAWSLSTLHLHGRAAKQVR